MENQLVQKDRQQSTILDHTKDKLNQLSREITFREGEVVALRNKIKDREAHCDAALVSNVLNKQELVKLSNKNEDKDQEIADLK